MTTVKLRQRGHFLGSVRDLCEPPSDGDFLQGPVGLDLLLSAINLLYQQQPGLSSPTGHRMKQEKQGFEVLLSWRLGCETSGLGGPQWTRVLRKERPCLLQGPLPSFHPPSLLLLGCSNLSSGQAHPALPPWPCSGLLPAARTVDMAGFGELPLGGA